jgi:hypothetical protein
MLYNVGSSSPRWPYCQPRLKLESTPSAIIDNTPLSLRIVFTRRLGRSNIEPILMSRIRRVARGVGVSGAEGVVDYELDTSKRERILYSILHFLETEKMDFD